MRRRGTAIVQSSKGFLLVADRSGWFMLPGGGARKGESRRRAAIRELHEETGLKTISAKFLFELGTSVSHKVFQINAIGHARPRHEIRKVAWWKPGKHIRMSNGTRKILEKFMEVKN